MGERERDTREKEREIQGRKRERYRGERERERESEIQGRKRGRDGEKERDRQWRKREGGERKKIQTQKNSWNFILSCFNPVTLQSDHPLFIPVVVSILEQPDSLLVQIGIATI